MLFQANIWDEKLNKLHVFEESSLRGAVCDKHTVARSVAFIPQSQFFPSNLQLLQKNFPNKSGHLSSLASGHHPLYFIIFPFSGLIITGGDDTGTSIETFPANCMNIPPFPAPGNLSSFSSSYSPPKGEVSTPSLLWTTVVN